MGSCTLFEFVEAKRPLGDILGFVIQGLDKENGATTDPWHTVLGYGAPLNVLNLQNMLHETPHGRACATPSGSRYSSPTFTIVDKKDTCMTEDVPNLLSSLYTLCLPPWLK